MRPAPWLLALALAGLGALPAGAAAQPAEEIERLPGYVDFERLGIYGDDDDLEVEVTLHDALIRIVSTALADEDPELADALGKLRSFRFRLFSLAEQDLAAGRRRTAETASRLEGQGWERVVRIRSDDAQSYLHLKWSGTEIVGLVALFVDDEGTFGLINVVGTIDPEQIGRIGQKFDLQVLEEAQQELGKDKGRSDRD